MHVAPTDDDDTVRFTVKTSRSNIANTEHAVAPHSILNKLISFGCYAVLFNYHALVCVLRLYDTEKYTHKRNDTVWNLNLDLYRRIDRREISYV